MKGIDQNTYLPGQQYQDIWNDNILPIYCWFCQGL